jgi:hypothetical protein
MLRVSWEFRHHDTHMAHLPSPMKSNETCIEGVIVSSHDTYDH